MGVWLSLLAMARLPHYKFTSLIGIGSAVNFTETLLPDTPPSDIELAEERGRLWQRISSYAPSGYYRISQDLIDVSNCHKYIPSLST